MVKSKLHYKISTLDSSSIDILKLWLIIGVVFIHSVTSGVNFSDGSLSYEAPLWLGNLQYIIQGIIATCAVPAYFVLSGLLQYKKPFSWVQNMKKKLYTLIIPYILLNSLWILFFIIAQNIDILALYFSRPDNLISNWEWRDFLGAYGLIDKYPLLYPLWFMRDLIILNILAPVIKKIVDKSPATVGILLTSGLLLGFNTHMFFLPISSLFFYVAGYYIVKYRLHFDDLKKIKLYPTLIAYTLAILSDYLTRSYFIHDTVHVLQIIIGIVFFAKLSTLLHEGWLKVRFLWLSQFAIAIYLFHEFTLTIFTKIVSRLLPTTTFFQMLQFFGSVLFVIAFCVIVSIVMRKITPKTYFLITGNR